MRVLRRKEQKELLLCVGVLQHRFVELAPVLNEVLPSREFENLYRSALHNLHLLAEGIDHNVGANFLGEAFEQSKLLLERGVRVEEDGYEQGDYGRQHSDRP